MNAETGVTRSVAVRGDIQIEVLAQGQGPRIVLLPSLGRGASDFDPVAERLAGAGFRALRPEPRGIGQSRGPMTGIDLHTYAADVAAVIEHDGGAAFVVGHVFGNRVARMLAVDRRPGAGGVSRRRQCGACAKPAAHPHGHQGQRQPVAAGCRAPQGAAFFAPGNDPRSWLAGWHPEVLNAQRIAGDRTGRAEDYAAGSAPILYLRPEHDPLAHAEDAEEFKRALGGRVAVVVIRNCSHAAVAEQPAAISDALIAFAGTLWDMPPR